MAAGGCHKERVLLGMPTERKQGRSTLLVTAAPELLVLLGVEEGQDVTPLPPVSQWRQRLPSLEQGRCRHHNWSHHRLQEWKRDSQPTEGAQQASSTWRGAASTAAT